MTNSLLAKSDLVAGSSRCADAAAQMAKHVPHVLSRAAVAGLALLAASLPSYADRIQDPHEERKVAMTMKSDLAQSLARDPLAPRLRSDHSRSVLPQRAISQNDVRTGAAAHRRGSEMAGMVSQFKGCANRRRRRGRLEGGYNLPLDYIWTSP